MNVYIVFLAIFDCGSTEGIVLGAFENKESAILKMLEGWEETVICNIDYDLKKYFDGAKNDEILSYGFKDEKLDEGVYAYFSNERAGLTNYNDGYDFQYYIKEVKIE